MVIDPSVALHAAARPPPRRAPAGQGEGILLIAGATGALGSELVRRMVGAQRFAQTRVLAREPIQDGMRGVESAWLPDVPIAQWPPVRADTALVCFDPPRLYNDRERALWTPTPAQLPELARWLRRCGVRTLAVVQPHAQGRLPEALKRGLATLDEHAVVEQGFDRLLIVRTAQKPAAASAANPAERLAAWMLSIARFMVPQSEQPVRAAKVAELVDMALRLAPDGVHVAAPEVVWQAAQGDLAGVVGRWLAPR